MAADGTKKWAYWKCANPACGFQSAGARDPKSGAVEKVCALASDCTATEEWGEVATYDDGRVEVGPDWVKVS